MSKELIQLKVEIEYWFFYLWHTCHRVYILKKKEHFSYLIESSKEGIETIAHTKWLPRYETTNKRSICYKSLLRKGEDVEDYSYGFSD